MNKLQSTIQSLRSWWNPLVENPVYWNSPQQFLVASTPSRALGLSPVFRAVTLISNDVARTAADFDSFQLEKLWSRPNQFTSGYDFRRALTAQCLMYGNAFALINRRGNGQVHELVALTPGTVSIVTSQNSTDPLYKTEFGLITPDDIIHLKATLTEGLLAHSPINLCKVELQLLLEQEMNQLNVMGSGASTPKVAFVSPLPIPVSARQAIQSDYMKGHGNGSGGKPVVLAEGMRIEHIQSMASDAGVEAIKKYSIQDCSRIFGVPTSYLAEANNSYGSMEWLSRMYYDGCLSHWFETWKAEFELKLGEAPVFDIDTLIRPSVSELYAALRTGVEAGIISRNEARDILDYDEQPGLDEYIVAKNMGTGGGQTNKGNDTSGKTAEGDNNAKPIPPSE